MVSVCFRLLQIINLKIFQIGAFFRLASDWFQNSFRLAQRISYCVFRFQIASDCFQIHFRLVWKNCKNFRFCLHISDCFRLAGASTEEDNVAASLDTEDEELRRTELERRMEAADDNLERWVEAAAEAVEITERGVKEAST